MGLEGIVSKHRGRAYRGGGDVARRLAKNLQRSNGILVQPTRKESILIESLQCRVSLGQLSHRWFRLLSGSPGGE